MNTAAPHVSFTVPGEPVPKGRPRASIRRRGKKLGIVMRTPEKTADYESTVRLIAQAHKPAGWPMFCHYAVHMLVYRGGAGGGDWDNYGKVSDAINPRKAKKATKRRASCPAVPGVLWSDDGRCRRGTVEIIDNDPQPRLVMHVTAIAAPCKNKGCGHRRSFYLDAAGRCETCQARAR